MDAIVTPINEKIRDELDKRKKYLTYQFSNDIEKRDWYGATAWCRMISNGIIYDDSNNKVIDGNDIVLMGGMLADGKLKGGFDAIYNSSLVGDYGKSKYFRPMPGITSMDIKYQGEYGMLKTAEVRWVCWDIEQLEYLEPLFMAPGITSILEWGWSTNIIDAINITEINLKDLYARDYFKDRAIASNGNYDGMLGNIVNFSWTLRKDGGFDCYTKMTTCGSMLYIDLKNKSNANTLSISDYFKHGFDTDIVDESQKGNNKLVYLYPNKTNPQYRYVTWQFLEGKINKYTSLRKNDIVVYTFNSNDSKITNHKYLLPQNPKEVLLPGQPRSLSGMDPFAIDDTSGYLKNILIETELIKTEFNNAETIGQAIESLLTRISNNCFNIWKFHIITGGEGVGTNTIVDLNHSENSIEKITNSGELYEFPIYGNNSLAKEVAMTSKLPPQLTAMFVYRNKLEDNKEHYLDSYIIGGLNKGKYYVKDKYLDGIEINTEGIKIIEKKDVVDVAKKYKEIHDNSKGFYYTLTDEELATFKDEIISDDDPESSFSSTRIIPIELEITTRGISGIYFGNVLIPDYITSVYKDNVIFIIMDVQHTIRNTWETRIRTIMNLKNI